MIDEFLALGKLEILQKSLAFVAGYGIKCYLISQDINQLKSRETGYGPDETITSNCHVQVAFPPNRLETAEHLSMKKLRSAGYQSPLEPHQEQIRSWRRVRKMRRTITQLSHKIGGVRRAIISAEQLGWAKPHLSEIVSGGIQ